MHFLRLRPLKEQLSTSGLPEKERLKYLLAWMLATTAIAFFPREAGPWDIATAFGTLIVLLGGILWAYRRNGGADGTGILDRYLSIGWVLNIRVLLILWAFVLLFDQAAEFAGLGDYLEEIQGPLNALECWIAEAYLAWAIARHIGDVRKAAETGGAAPAPVPDRTVENLEKFVEAVVKREMSATARPRRRRLAAAIRRLRRPRRRK